VRRSRRGSVLHSVRGHDVDGRQCHSADPRRASSSHWNVTDPSPLVRRHRLTRLRSPGPLPVPDQNVGHCARDPWVMVHFFSGHGQRGRHILRTRVGCGPTSRDSRRTSPDIRSPTCSWNPRLLPVAAVVPLGLYLLARTGQDRHDLGLEAAYFHARRHTGQGTWTRGLGVELVS